MLAARAPQAKTVVKVGQNFDKTFWTCASLHKFHIEYIARDCNKKIYSRHITPKQRTVPFRHHWRLYDVVLKFGSAGI